MTRQTFPTYVIGTFADDIKFITKEHVIIIKNNKVVQLVLINIKEHIIIMNH